MRPFHFWLVPVPIACFGGAWLTDLTYWSSAEMMWADFSSWLVVVGLILAVVTVIVGLIDFLRDRRRFGLGPIWPSAVAQLVALLLALFDVLVHSRDAWTSVVPAGLILSVATAVAMIAAAWMGWAVVYRRCVEVPA